MITFELVALDGVKFSSDVYEVVLPTPMGYIGVLPGHMPLVSLVTSGTISVRKNERDADNQMDVFATNGGVMDVVDNKLRLLVNEADNADDINEQEAVKAYEQAQKLAKEAKDPISLTNAQNMIAMSSARIKVSELKRGSRTRSRVIK